MGSDIYVALSEEQKAVSERLKTTPKIDKAYTTVYQYDACQKITANRCEEVLLPVKLAEVRDAQMVVELHKTRLEEINKQLYEADKK